MSRVELLEFIGDDAKLQGLAANMESWIQRNRPDLQPGSDEFYAAVLRRIRVLANGLEFGQPGDPPGDSWKKPTPPLPVFKAVATDEESDHNG